MFLLALLACSGAPEAPPPALLRRAGSGAPIRLLDQLDDARLDLPADSVPEGAQIAAEMPLSGWRRYPEHPGAWYCALPIRTERQRYFAPPGDFQLLHEGRSLPFVNLPAKAAAGSWDIYDGHAILLSEDDPDDWAAPVTLVAEAAAEREIRRSFGRASLSAPLFAELETTVGTDTLRGLLLPAPATARFQLDLPAGARLSLTPGILPVDLLDATGSDGAEVEIRVDGQAVQRLSIDPLTGLVPAEVDLSEHGGRSVELTIATLPGDTPDWDYVFLGEPIVQGAPEQPPRRVILIGIDTLRYDAMSQHGYHRDTTAPWDDLAERSLIFDNAFTPAPRTRPSFRSLLTGQWPLDAIEAPPMATAFRAAGWRTAGIVSNVHLVPRFGFHEGSDLWRYENGLDADVQVARAQDWLIENRDRDSFLFLHLIDPHVFYRAPERWDIRYGDAQPGNLRAELNRWQLLQLEEQGRLSEESKLWLRDRYDGEIRFMAEQLAELFAFVEELPGETLLVVANDHGEEFWEHGSYEHNHSLYQELVRGILWIKPPGGWGGGPHRTDAPVGWIDVAPTLLDAAGVPEELWPPDLPGRSLRPLFDRDLQAQRESLEAELAARPLPIGHLMYDREQWAVIADGHKYILETSTGAEQLYDLRADPEELDDLAVDAEPGDHDRWLAALSQATGWPAGPGWRVKLTLAREPITFVFDQPVRAQIVDPEADKTRRANLSWGEASEKGPDDVGALSFSDDGKSITFTPGPDPAGGIIAFAVPRGATAKVVAGEVEKALHDKIDRVRVGDAAFIRVRPGPVILPGDSVRDHLPNAGRADAASVESLRSLGYVE